MGQERCAELSWLLCLGLQKLQSKMLARLTAVQADGCDVVVSRFQNSFAVVGLKGQLSYWLSAESCLQLLPALQFCPSWLSQDTAVECFRASRRITWKPSLFWKINVKEPLVLFTHAVCFFSQLIQFIFIILFVFSHLMKYQASLLNFHTYFLWWSSLPAPCPHSTAHTPSPTFTLAPPVLFFIIRSTFLL